MEKSPQDKRKYPRYNTDVEVFFQIAYDFRTKVNYQVVEQEKTLSRKYSALSRNISAEGICFVSEKKLEKGDVLSMEIQLPGEKAVIPMTGEVRWSSLASDETISDNKFDTGVKLLTVNGKTVADSIYFDKDNQVVWSVALEEIVGQFRITAQERKKK